MVDRCTLLVTLLSEIDRPGNGGESTMSEPFLSGHCKQVNTFRGEDAFKKFLCIHCGLLSLRKIRGARAPLPRVTWG